MSRHKLELSLRYLAGLLKRPVDQSERLRIALHRNHPELDADRIIENIKIQGFTKEAKQWLTQAILCGYMDRDVTRSLAESVPHVLAVFADSRGLYGFKELLDRTPIETLMFLNFLSELPRFRPQS